VRPDLSYSASDDISLFFLFFFVDRNNRAPLRTFRDAVDMLVGRYAPASTLPLVFGKILFLPATLPFFYQLRVNFIPDLSPLLVAKINSRRRTSPELLLRFFCLPQAFSIFSNSE